MRFALPVCLMSLVLASCAHQPAGENAKRDNRDDQTLSSLNDCPDNAYERSARSTRTQRERECDQAQGQQEQDRRRVPLELDRTLDSLGGTLSNPGATASGVLQRL